VDVDLGELRLADGDTLLVCSDGLHGCVEDAQISATLSAEPPSRACDRLVQLALAAGAPDNVSCLVARVNGALSAASSRPRLDKVTLPSEPTPEAPLARVMASPAEPGGAVEGPLARLRAFFQGD
jgi:PPM family protein phosphatase